MASLWMSFCAAIGWISSTASSAFEAVVAFLGLAAEISTRRLPAPSNFNVTQFDDFEFNTTFNSHLFTCEPPLTLRRIFESCPLYPVTKGPLFTAAPLNATTSLNTTALAVWEAPIKAPTFTDLCVQFFRLLSYLWKSFCHAQFGAKHAKWVPYAPQAVLVIIAVLALLAAIFCLRMRQRWSALKGHVRYGLSPCWSSVHMMIDAIENGIGNEYAEDIVRAEVHREKFYAKAMKQLQKENAYLIKCATQAEKTHDDAVSEIARLKEENETLQGDIRCFKEALVTHDKIANGLEEDKTALELSIAALRGEKYGLETAAQSLENRIYALSSDKKRFHESAMSLETQVKEAIEREIKEQSAHELTHCSLSIAQADGERLKRSEAALVSDLKVKDEKIEKLQRENATQASTVEAKDREIHTLRKRGGMMIQHTNEKLKKTEELWKDQLAHVKKLEAVIQHQNNQMQAVAAQKNAEIANLTGENAGLKLNYDRLTNQMSTLTSEKEEKIAILTGENSELITENLKLFSDKDKLKEEIKRTNQKISVLEGDNAALLVQLEESEKCLVYWKREDNDVFQLNDALAEKLTEVENKAKELEEQTIPGYVRYGAFLLNQVRSLKWAKATVESQVAALAERTFDLQEQLGEAEDVKAELVRERLALQAEKAELSDHKTALAEKVTGLEEKLAKTVAENGSLVLQMSAFDATNPALSGQVATLTDEVPSLQVNLAYTRAENEGLVRDKSALVTTISKLDGQMSELAKEFSDLKSNLARSDAEKEDLVRETEALDTKHSKLHEQYTELDIEILRLKNHFGRVEVEKANLGHDKAELEAENSTLTGSSAGFATQKSMLSQQNNQLLEENARLSEQNIELIVEKNNLSQNFEHSEANSAQLRHRVSAAEQEIAELREDLRKCKKDQESGAESDEELVSTYLALTLDAEEQESHAVTAASSEGEANTPPTLTSETVSCEVHTSSELGASPSSDPACAPDADVTQSQEGQWSSGPETPNVQTSKAETSAVASSTTLLAVPESSASEQADPDSCQSSTSPPDESTETVISDSTMTPSKSTSVVADPGISPDHTSKGLTEPGMTKTLFDVIRKENGKRHITGIEHEREFIRFLVHETLTNNTVKVLETLPCPSVLGPHLEGLSHSEQFLALMNDHLADSVKDEVVTLGHAKGLKNKTIGKNFSLVFAWLFLHYGLNMREAFLAAQEAGRSDAEIFCSLYKLGFRDLEIMDALLQLKPDSDPNDLLQMVKDLGHYPKKLEEMIFGVLGPAEPKVKGNPKSQQPDSTSQQSVAPQHGVLASVIPQDVLPKHGPMSTSEGPQSGASLRATAPLFTPISTHPRSGPASITQLAYPHQQRPRTTAPLTSINNGLLGSRYFQQLDTSTPPAQPNTSHSSTAARTMNPYAHLLWELPHSRLHGLRHSHAPPQPILRAPAVMPQNLNWPYHGTRGPTSGGWRGGQGAQPYHHRRGGPPST